MEPRVLEFAKQGKITEAHCKLLLAITDPEKQYLTAVDIIERGTTTRELEQNNKKINKKEVSKEELKRIEKADARKLKLKDETEKTKDKKQKKKSNDSYVNEKVAKPSLSHQQFSDIIKAITSIPKKIKDKINII